MISSGTDNRCPSFNSGSDLFIEILINKKIINKLFCSESWILTERYCNTLLLGKANLRKVYDPKLDKEIRRIKINGELNKLYKCSNLLYIKSHRHECLFRLSPLFKLFFTSVKHLDSVHGQVMCINNQTPLSQTFRNIFEWLGHVKRMEWTKLVLHDNLNDKQVANQT